MLARTARDIILSSMSVRFLSRRRPLWWGLLDLVQGLLDDEQVWEAYKIVRWLLEIQSLDLGFVKSAYNQFFFRPASVLGGDVETATVTGVLLANMCKLFPDC
jgi:hypothetical protein